MAVIKTSSDVTTAILGCLHPTRRQTTKGGTQGARLGCSPQRQAESCALTALPRPLAREENNIHFQSAGTQNLDNAQNPQGPEKWQSGLQPFLDLSGYRISIQATGPCQGGPEVTAQSTLHRETVPKYISDRTPVQSRISRMPQQYFKSKGERTYRKKS